MHLLIFLCLGLLVGALARVTMPERGTGWVASLLGGVVGAFVGGFLGADGMVGGYVMSLVGAVLVSVAYRMFVPRVAA